MNGSFFWIAGVIVAALGQILRATIDAAVAHSPFSTDRAENTDQTMELSLIEESGVQCIEGVPDQRFMAGPDDAHLLLEACLSNRVRLVLLYAKNLTDRFFDLSSGEAGAVLQKLRNYGVRLALVCPADSVEFSSRFGEMVAEEQLRSHFGVFATRKAARAWLGRLAASLKANDLSR